MLKNGANSTSVDRFGKKNHFLGIHVYCKIILTKLLAYFACDSI